VTENVIQFARPSVVDQLSDTDIANAARLATRHGLSFRYTADAGFLVWDDKRWAEDPKDVRIQALAKETALAIYDDIRGSPVQKEVFAHAKRSQSKRAIDAMVVLSRSEPGILASITAFDRDPYLFNDRPTDRGAEGPSP